MRGTSEEAMVKSKWALSGEKQEAVAAAIPHRKEVGSGWPERRKAVVTPVVRGGGKGIRRLREG